MLRFESLDEWLDPRAIIRVKRVSQAGADPVLLVWPVGTDPTNTGRALRLTGADADVVLAHLGEEPEAEDADGVDGLTQINGVGPKTVEALAAAGLDSFAAVAEATPEALRSALDAANIKAVSDDEVARWQAEAGELASGS